MRESLKPANRVVHEMHGLERTIRHAHVDNHVDRNEKRDIVGRSRTIEKHAQSMVAHQGQPVVAQMDHIQKLAHEGKLGIRAPQVLADVAHERARTWERAKHDANTNPFEHMHHMKAPHPGMRTRDFTWHGHKVHVIAVDLNNPHVHVQTTSEAERGAHVGTLARRHHAEAAINGDFFSFGSYKTSGVAMQHGHKWGGNADGFEDGLVFNGRHAQILPHMGSVPDWAKGIVSARHTVVAGGHVFSQRELLRRNPVASEQEKVRENKPRTGVGLSKSGRVLYMVAIDHAPEHMVGKLLREYGAHYGFAMDSGGSAEMYRRGKGVLQDGYGGSEHRHVANAILIQANRH